MLENGEEDLCWNNAQSNEPSREFPRGHLQTVQSPLPYDPTPITTDYQDQRATLLFLFIFPASSLGQNMTVNLDASVSTFATLPVLPPAPQPTFQLFWESPEPLLTGSISPWNPLVLSALPGMSLVAEDGSTTLGTAVPLNIVQVGKTGRPVQAMPNANLFLTQVPLKCNVPVTQASCPVGSCPVPRELSTTSKRSPANVQTNSPETRLSKPDSVYGNIRRWQHIKILVQQHLFYTPDMSSFSCFLMFTEFDSAEEKENSRLEMMRSIKCHVLTTTRQDPSRPPNSEVFEESACNSMKTGSKTDPARLPVLRHRQLQKTEAPMEIPPEAMQEYMDIMDWLERLPQSYTGEPTEKEEEENSELEQEEDDFYSDAGVLSYIDELCSQKHFIDQMVEEHSLALKKKGCKRATLNPGAPQILSNTSVPTVFQLAKREGHGPQRGTSAQKRSSLVPSLDHQFPGATNAEIWGPSPTVFQSSQCLPSLGDLSSTVITYGRGAHPQSPGSRCAMSLRGVSAMEEFQEALGRTIEDKEEIPSLSFLLCSHYSLVPWKLSGYLCPYTGLSDSASIPKPLSPKRSDLSPDPSSTDKSEEPALIGGLNPMAKRSNSGIGHGIFEGPLSALGLTHSLQAQKKVESLRTRKRKRKKWHCATCGISPQSWQSFTLPPPCTPIPKMKKKTH
ncbi:Protein FAM22 [Cricetulus griseus]|uniref:Protein FAM22 n=1 Tax=Cricetulus griseus TaxID=10029 RepID=G3IFY5_CRIGR|nr:Protein FAM22 [Cricetulus griseus]